MPKPKNNKGLQALASEEVQEIAREGDKNPLLEQHRAKLLESLEPQFQAAEEAVAYAQQDLLRFEKMYQLVGMQRVTIQDMENDPTSQYYFLKQQKADIESQINAKSRKVNGINIPRVSDVNPLRAKIADIDKELSAIRDGVTQFWAGYFGVASDEAYRLVRDENEAYKARKS